MMKFLLALVIVISGCGGGAATNKMSAETDQRAADIREVMDHTVAIKIDVTLPILDTNKKPEVSFIHRTFGGSGFVLEWDPSSGHSMVITAGHVCAVPDILVIDDKKIPVMGLKWLVKNKNGTELSAIPLQIDEGQDVCVLDVDGWSGTIVKMNDGMPPFGARLLTAGNPQGEFDRNFVPVQEGVFFGMKIGPQNRYLMGSSIPVISGMSGSGVYYRGRLVGMVIQVRKDFEHFSYLVHLGNILKVALEAREKWHPSPKSTLPSRM